MMSKRVAAPLLAWCLMGALIGCRGYPEATSLESQDFIKQVYTACNTRSESRLDRCEQRLAELLKSDRISQVEAAAFEKILKRARNGEWEAAQDQALEFAQQQLR
jgi:hypothetical protein